MHIEEKILRISSPRRVGNDPNSGEQIMAGRGIEQVNVPGVEAQA